MKRQQKYWAAGAIALLALAGTALAAAYVADKDELAPQQTQTRVVRTNTQQVARVQQPAQQQVQQAPCDDSNIVGTIAGGVGGALIGSQIGSGSGQTVATTAGALGGAALGNKFIPTRGMTCN